MHPCVKKTGILYCTVSLILIVSIEELWLSSGVTMCICYHTLEEDIAQLLPRD